MAARKTQKKQTRGAPRRSTSTTNEPSQTDLHLKRLADAVEHSNTLLAKIADGVRNADRIVAKLETLLNRDLSADEVIKADAKTREEREHDEDRPQSDAFRTVHREGIAEAKPLDTERTTALADATVKQTPGGVVFPETRQS